MSIEEKARAYDNILEKARKWYNANTNAGYRSIFEDIFPQLAESEDERIRKALISVLKSDFENDTTIHDRWLAVRPTLTLLKDLECPRCHIRGYVIETGEIVNT